MAKQLIKNGISEETEKLVKDFYIRSDIVYTMPGLKDEMTVWTSGVKERLRNYYLCMYIKEVHNLLKNAYPDIEIGYSKFASLRPRNIMLLKDQPEDQCKCKIHENFSLKLKALKIEYDGGFWQKFLCEDAVVEDEFWKTECESCKSGHLFAKHMENVDFSEAVVWRKWCKNDAGNIHIEYVDGCKGQLIEEVCSDRAKFIEHVRVKRIQSKAFEADKANERVTVCQCDFAMAYSCSYQDEIQSALWSRANVNLFTVALYQRDLPCQSMLFVTESNDKGKNAVLTFLLKIAECLKGIDVGECFILYTDGPSSELKNKFVLKMMSLVSQILRCEVRWQYFATSHGKGVVDGIGGAAKSAVRRRVLSKGGPVVQCASDFVREVRKDLKNVKVLEVSKKEIDEKGDLWEDVEKLDGIKKVHTISLNSGSCKLYATNFDFFTGVNKMAEIIFEDPVVHAPFTALNVGDWVAVRYDDQAYPGEVLSLRGLRLRSLS